MNESNRERSRQALQYDALRRTKEENERWEREHPNALAEIDQDRAMPVLDDLGDAAGAAHAEEQREEKTRQWESDMCALADAHGGVLPPDPAFKYSSTQPVVRLDEVPAVPSDAAADTEALLNGLIAECRFLVREVAFHSARLTPNPDDRMRFLSAAESLVITGAKVGDAVARLRGGGSVVEERRQRILVEHIQNISASPGGEGGTA
ncbi:MAG: hypothetical protein KGL56_07430 [Alphaproteobacteria bacterium]|nr:hypothetical protein [Alphaproteobacteria bacterium]MDE2500008.1 hypothetical protein [Alphaproteobacteria bacterium]